MKQHSFFERSHENVSIGGSHACAHGCALCFLGSVGCSEEEVVLFEDEVE